VRVISPLADMDLEVRSISREGSLIIVEAASGTTGTRIELSPRDTVGMLGHALRRPALWLYLLTLPYLYWRNRRGGQIASPPDPNDPWRS
jgi:hypothetical protein